MQKRRLTWILFVLTAIFGLHAQINLVNSNLKQRLDQTGALVDLKEGCLLQSNGHFFWYGLSSKNVIQCYKSTDWTSWEPTSMSVSKMPEGRVDCIKILFNQQTKKYVLWFRLCKKTGQFVYVSAQSNQPAGVFTIVEENVPVFNQADGLGRFALYSDTAGVGYLAYSTLNNGAVSIEMLRSDFLASTRKNGGTVAMEQTVEAFFQHRGKYYLFLNQKVGSENQGSSVRMMVSNFPSNSFVYRRNLNVYPGSFAPLLTDGNLSPTVFSIVKKSTNGSFPPIQLERSATSEVTQIKLLLYTGGRGQLPDGSFKPYMVPSAVVKQWKYGGWVDLRATQQAFTSSVYTVVSLKFPASNATQFQIQLQSNQQDFMYINEIEMLDEKAPTIQKIRSYVCDIREEESSFRIPGKTCDVFELSTKEGKQWIWMALLPGSFSGNAPSVDYTYFGNPLIFNDYGDVEPFEWTEGWTKVLSE